MASNVGQKKVVASMKASVFFLFVRRCDKTKL